MMLSLVWLQTELDSTQSYYDFQFLTGGSFWSLRKKQALIYITGIVSLNE